MRKSLAVCAVAALLLAGCGSDDESEASDGPSVDLADAAAACEEPVQAVMDEGAFEGGPDPLPAEAALAVGDGGDTVTVTNREPDLPYLEEASVVAMTCMLSETGAPDSVQSEIGQTTGLSGRQETSWDGVELSYTYLKGTGFNAVFTVAE